VANKRCKTFTIVPLLFATSLILWSSIAVSITTSNRQIFNNTQNTNHAIKEENTFVEIKNPHNGIYIFGTRVLPIAGQIVIGKLQVEVEASDDIRRVEFLLKPKCGCRLDIMFNDTELPFAWTWNENSERVFDDGLFALQVKGYIDTYNNTEDNTLILRIIA
jgi:hypothetical protein